MTRLKELREELGQLDDASKKILDTAEARDKALVNKKEPAAGLTSEESQEWDRMDARIQAIEGEIKRRDAMHRREAEALQAGGRQSAPADPVVPVDRADPTGAPGLPTNGPVSLDIGCKRKWAINPGTPEYGRLSEDYEAAFAAYLATGVRADLQVTPDTKGGYLAPTRFEAELIKFIDDTVFMRDLGRVLPSLGRAVSLGAPSLDTDLADSDWTAEVPAADLSEDTSLTLGKRELMPHLSTKLVKVSQKLLRASQIGIEELVRERMGYKFGITEEKAFLTGDGAQQPLGVFVAHADGIPTGRDTTASATTSFTADNLIDTHDSMKAGYWPFLTWLMHRNTYTRIRKLKDGIGQYLWRPGLADGTPSTILDRPYKLSEYAPNTYTTGLYVAIIGDFRNYWIVDALGLEIQRLMELFQLRNQIGFLGRRETDGMPVLGEAFARLILA